MAKILIVDDSKSIRTMVSAVLAAAGHEVKEAIDGHDALKVAQSDRFNLVISDVNMPIMDGFELVAELRKMEGYRYIPIVFLTTAESEFFRNKGREAGATAWITKPFNAQKLMDVLSKVTDLW